MSEMWDPTEEPQTFGDLKRIIAESPRGDWPSRVNPSMTHTQALDVLTKALAGHEDGTRLADSARGTLLRRNVVRECRVRLEEVSK